MTTRFLYTGISSALYDGDRTLDDLLAAFATDALAAFEDGVCVPWLSSK